MEKYIIFTLLVTLFLDYSSADGVPALLWTNKENVRYPMLISGKTLSSKDFGDGYLEQVIENGDQNLAVFIQDQLSLNDITNYADVFNDHSNGATFSSLKSIMEKYESTHVANVEKPADALKKLQRKFKGKIHNVDNPEDIGKIELDDDIPNMVVIHMPKAVDSERKASLKESDEIIARVTDVLSKKNKAFSAVYTASEATKPSEEHENAAGRHLLQAPEATDDANNLNYTFFKISSSTEANSSSCVFLFTRKMTFHVVQIKLADGKNYRHNGTIYAFPNLGNDTQAITTGSSCNSTSSNSTAVLKLDFKEHLPEGLTKFTMSMAFKRTAGYWSIGSWNISFAGKNVSDTTGNQVFDQDDWPMDTRKDSLYGTMPYANPSSRGYSYHCGKENIPQRDSNSTGDVIIELLLDGFQLQYTVKGGVFGPANECVGFFSGAIWMTLIFFALMLAIIMFGMGLIASIQTMDRFDDPKGKTIQVNTSD